ncbi:MAG: hypothetical protein HQL38_15600 [Alphaproteobacteria bacterium]|nr:hypothetical protein [Alphaproteobacteria bacterium]MBF0394103.1 hypothetical protein [Alphaproteobacteria bacterium]
MHAGYLISAVITLTATLGGCGGVNNALVQKRQSVEYYRIYDIKTNANKQALAKAASDGLGRNTASVSTAMPIPVSAEVPEKPGRFRIADPLAGSKIGALAASGGGIGIKVADCDGAIWTARANRNTAGSTALNLWACLYQYKGGYHLDMYAVFTKIEGGLYEVSRQMAYAAVGTPEEWTEKTFSDVVREIGEQTGAQTIYLEGHPDPGSLPWHDRGGQPATPGM